LLFGATADTAGGYVAGSIEANIPNSTGTLVGEIAGGVINGAGDGVTVLVLWEYGDYRHRGFTVSIHGARERCRHELVLLSRQVLFTAAGKVYKRGSDRFEWRN
jgi:hypothetical protein